MWSQCLTRRIDLANKGREWDFNFFPRVVVVFWGSELEWKPAVREFTTVLSIGEEEATKLSTNINWLTCRKFLTRFVVCLLIMVVGSSSDFRSWRPGETGELSGLFLGPSKPQCFLYMKSNRFPFWSVIEANLFVSTLKKDTSLTKSF